VSYVVLRRTVGGLDTPRLLRFLVRMGIVLVVMAAVAWGVERALAGLGEYPGPLPSLLRGGLSAAAGTLVLLAGARLLRVREVTSLVDIVAARLRRG
jgi:putative peptidoglycan lipid II flippase